MNEQELAAVRGLDPSVVAEMVRQTSLSAEEATEQLKRLGEALMEAETDDASPITYTNRAARRARERAGRKHR